MLDQDTSLLTQNTWWTYFVRIVSFFALAWVVQWVVRWIVSRALQLSRFRPKTRRPRPERQATLRSVLGGTISFVAFAAAT